MTIKERFAKYTIEELQENIAMIEKRSEENRKAMEHYRAEKNLEFYKTARDLWDRDCEILIDAQCALDARLRDNK